MDEPEDTLAGLPIDSLMNLSAMVGQLVSMAEGMRQDMVGKGWSEGIAEQAAGSFLLLLMAKAFA